jgi:hypothetical protein
MDFRGNKKDEEWRFTNIKADRDDEVFAGDAADR